MCSTCGCGQPEHDHQHGHHHHDHEHETKVTLETDILAENNRFAADNRKFFYQNDIAAYNLVSSPGSGKTTLLEATCACLMADGVKVAVIEGDQQTDNDANRMKAAGVAAVQINTQAGCHLDAHSVGHATEHLNPAPGSVLFIENVGNLVCPAMFDLGEKARVVVISVTEGDDKPLKYPYMFAGSQICIINKIDLLPYLNSNVETIKANALKVNPRLRFFEISATTGQGMQPWIDYLEGK